MEAECNELQLALSCLPWRQCGPLSQPPEHCKAEAHPLGGKVPPSMLLQHDSSRHPLLHGSSACCLPLAQLGCSSEAVPLQPAPHGCLHHCGPPVGLVASESPAQAQLLLSYSMVHQSVECMPQHISDA